MSLKQRILTISESAERNHFFELRAIAMEVRKMEDRVNQLDEELERTKQERNAIAKNVREPLLLQLDHAKERIKRLEAVTNDPHALWTNWLRGDVKLPVGIGDVRQYENRIKRLEEAGDGMVNEGWNEPHLAEAWRKAKEAKL